LGIAPAVGLFDPTAAIDPVVGNRGEDFMIGGLETRRNRNQPPAGAVSAMALPRVRRGLYSNRLWQGVGALNLQPAIAHVISFSVEGSDHLQLFSARGTFRETAYI
jgi:hypothetical protein